MNSSLFYSFISVFTEATVNSIYANNVHLFGNTVKCRCMRTVGTVLREGEMKFTNTRVVTYKPVLLNFGETPGKHVLFTFAEEKRCLIGYHSAIKRKLLDVDVLPEKRFCSQNVDVYRASIQLDDNIAPEPMEDFLDTEQNEDLFGWHYFSDFDDDFNFEQSDGDQFLNDEEIQRQNELDFSPSNADAFFDEETMPYPPVNFDDLPDYDSDSSEQPPLIPYPGVNYLSRRNYLLNDELPNYSSENMLEYDNLDNQPIGYSSPAVSYTDDTLGVSPAGGSIESLPSAFDYELSNEANVDEFIPEFWSSFFDQVANDTAVYEPTTQNE